MTTDIFIVSVGKHFNYLQYCLRSIGKFAKGFDSVVVLIPEKDNSAFAPLAAEYKGEVPLRGIIFSEWPDQGMLHHMFQIMHADQWSEADLILHTDSDCVFTEPVTPEDYIENGKPVLMHADFDWLCTTQQANLRMWQEATLNAIGPPVTQETMRRHPAVHWRELYGKARRQIESHTHKGMVEFMRAQRNEFPQSFCEFVTLGNVALREMKNRYRWRDQRTEGFPHSKIYQAWSHQPPTPENLAFYKTLGIA